MDTWVDFKELRARLKIADVLSRHNVQLKVKGDRATGFCPLPGHQSKGEGKRHSPSFSANLAKNLFNCFSCHRGGNALDLACLLDGGNPDDPISLRKTALKLQSELGVESTKPAAPGAILSTLTREEKPLASSNVIINAPLDFELKLDPSHPYPASRGLTEETIRHFGLGYCAKGMLAERISLPLHDAPGRLIGYAGRVVEDSKITDENPKYRFPGTRERKGIMYEFRKSEFLYNGHRVARPVKNLIVVEGFFSAAWLWQHGWTATIALMGNSCSQKQADLIVDLVHPAGGVLIFPDGNQPGELCAANVLHRVSPYRLCRWIKVADDQQPTDFDRVGLEKLLRY